MLDGVGSLGAVEGFCLGAVCFVEAHSCGLGGSSRFCRWFSEEARKSFLFGLLLYWRFSRRVSLEGFIIVRIVDFVDVIVGRRRGLRGARGSILCIRCVMELGEVAGVTSSMSSSESISTGALLGLDGFETSGREAFADLSAERAEARLVRVLELDLVMVGSGGRSEANMCWVRFRKGKLLLELRCVRWRRCACFCTTCTVVCCNP